MAGEIKSTLTLDVTKFASAIDRAIGGAESLEKHLKSAAKVAADFDKGIAGVGSDLTSVAKNFRLLDQSVESMVGKLATIIGRFDQLGSQTANAAKGVERLGSAVKKTTDINADQWIKKYSNELGRLSPALKAAVSSIIDFDRANIASAASAEKAAEKTSAAKQKVLLSERDANRKIIAEREKLAAELLAIQGQMQKRADANAAVAGNYRGRNINHPNAVAYRGEAATAQNAANTAAAERAALVAVVKELKWRNAEIEKSIALEAKKKAAIEEAAKADKDAATASKNAKKAEADAARAARDAATAAAAASRDAARERMRLAKEAAAYEKQQAQEVAQMWKSMGQLWAASKVQAGLGAVVQKGSEGQQAQLRVDILGLPAAEMEEFNRKAYDLARQEKYLSNIDAINARYTAITSLGKNKVDIIDGSLTDAMRTVQALKVAGFESGSATDIQRNLYGVAEMRQVINDVEATKRTFDTVFRAAKASGGKINVADLETILRNVGPAASQLSDKGILNLLALAEQMKVAGGHGQGSSGTGVSTVGTMVKMMQLYAAGKPMKLEAIEQFMGAGLMNEDAFKGGDKGFGKTERDALKTVSWKAARSAGLKDAESLMADPMTYMKNIREPLLEYMLKNQGTYFDKGADVNSVEAQNAAFTKFFARSGYSHRAVSMMVMGMDPRFMHRMEDNTKLAQQGDGAAETIEKAREGWTQAVSEMKAGAENLALAFSPILKPLGEIVKALGAVMNKAAEFVRENPLIGMANLSAAALGGLVLAVKGTVGVLGSVGGALNPIKVLMTGFSASLGSVAGAMGGLRAMVLAAGIAFPSLAGAISAVVSPIGAVVSGMGAVSGAIGGAIGWLARLSGGLLGFIARWASPIGWAALAGQLGWVIGKWVSDLEVGGLTIGERMQNIFLSIEVGWKSTLLDIQEKWLNFKKLIGGDDFLGESAERKELEAERAKLEQYRKDMQIPVREEFVGPPAPAKGAKKADGQPSSGTGFGEPSNYTVGSGRQGGGGAGGRREFENAFQRSLEQFVGRSQIESLKLGTILNKTPSYDEQAKAAFMEKWLGGDFDDGKDPSKRKFVQGGRAYDKEKGWSAADVDLTAKDKQTGKTPEDWMREYAAAKKLQDIVNGVKFATERAAATNEDAAVSLERLTGKTAGQTDAMKALNREFARQEASNPALTEDAHYLAEKRDAKTGRATADYANEAADLVQKNKEMEASFLLTERERLEASINAKAEVERKKVEIVIQGLDEQIRAHEAAGDLESEAYLSAIKARQEGEEQFTRYLQNIQRDRELALMSPVSKMVREWHDVYKQLETLQEQWANSFMDNLGQLITTGKADWRSFMISIMNDLAKVMMKKAAAGLLDDLTGTAGVGGIAKAAWNGTAVAGGGWLGGKVNDWRGMQAPATGGAGASAAPGMAGALGGGLKGGLGVGDDAAEGAKKLGESLRGADAALQATTTAQQGATAAVTASTAATTTDTAAVTTNTAATATNTTAEAVNTGVVTTDTVAETANTTITQTGEVPAATAATAAMGTLATAATAAAAKMLMSANGNAFGAGGLITAFANGGSFTNSIVDTPTFFNFGGSNLGVMGEAGPEAVMPLSRDGKGRLGVTVNNSEGDAGGTMVNIAITVNSDGEKAAASGDGAGDWRKMANRIKGVVIEELVAQQRPGGVLYK